VGKRLRKKIIIGAVIYTIGLFMVMSYSIVRGESNYFSYRAHLESVRNSLENNQPVMTEKNETKTDDETSFDNAREETSSQDSEDKNIGTMDSNTYGEDNSGDETDNSSLDSQSQEEEYSAVKFERVLRKGLSGDDVRKLQYLLIKKDYYDGEITGYMGDSTVEALKRFQQSVGEQQDGVLGPSTRDKVLE
jgi:murein L,D-transpeptidase YcbB/YkuD